MNLRSIVPCRVSGPARIFLIATALDGVGNGVFNVVYQLYLVSLGFNSADIGTVFAIGSVGGLLLTLPAGLLADRYSRSKVLVIGFSLDAAGLVVLSAAKSLEMLSLSSLLTGLGFAGRSVLTPFYSGFFEKSDMDRAFGFYGFLGILGHSIGSLFGLLPQWLTSNYGFGLPYAYWIILMLSVLLLSAAMAFFILSIRHASEPSRLRGPKTKLRSKSLVAKYTLLAVVNNIGYGLFFSLFPYYVNKKFGVESAGLGALFFISRFVTAGVNTLAPHVSDRIGTLRAIVTALSLSIPFYLMIPLSPSYTWLSAFYILRIGIANISPPLAGSLYMKLLHEEEKATANSVTATASMLGSIAGPWIGGQLMERASLDLPAYLGVGLFAAYTASFYALLRKEAQAAHATS